MNVVLHLNMSVNKELNSNLMLKALEDALSTYCVATGQIIALQQAYVTTEQAVKLDKILPLKEEQ